MGTGSIGGGSHGMKEPVLNITLLLTVSLAAFWKTWLNQQKGHLQRNTLTCGTCVCNSSLSLALKTSKNVHSSHLIGDTQETDICRVGLTQKLGNPSELSSGQQQCGVKTVQNTNRQPGSGRKLQQ